MSNRSLHLRHRRSPARIVFDFANTLGFLVFTFLTVFPFYYIAVYSFSTPSAAAAQGIFILPQQFTLVNYLELFNHTDILRPALVSISRTVIGTTVTVLATSFFAYLTTQRKLPLRRLIFRLVVITMYVDAGLIPKYLLYGTIGITNTFLVYILPTAIIGFYLILVKTYVESIPDSLEESAKIDGAGVVLTFARIVFPVCKPIIATVAVFAAVGQWNMWFDNFIFADTPGLKTLQKLLLDFLRDMSASQLSIEALQQGSFTVSPVSPRSIQMAITFLVTVPIIVVYPLMQRHFTKGIMIGAVKG